MKLKITKTLDMYDKIIYCEAHDVFISMPDMTDHIDCKPKCTVIISFAWDDILSKCMNVKTGPNIIDMFEGKYSPKWLKNESDRVKLVNAIEQRSNNDSV